MPCFRVICFACPAVQSCWNGIAVLDPAPFYNPPHVRFRMAKLSEGECSASECGLICSESPPHHRKKRSRVFSSRLMIGVGCR